VPLTVRSEGLHGQGIPQQASQTTQITGSSLLLLGLSSSSAASLNRTGGCQASAQRVVSREMAELDSYLESQSPALSESRASEPQDLQDLLSGADPTFKAKQVDAELDELLEAMYPDGRAPPPRKVHSSSVDRRSSNPSRQRKSQAEQTRVQRGRGAGSESLQVNGKNLHGEDAETARLMMERANRLMQRAVTAGVVKAGRSQSDCFKEGFLTEVRVDSPSRLRAKSQGRARPTPTRNRPTPGSKTPSKARPSAADFDAALSRHKTPSRRELGK